SDEKVYDNEPLFNTTVYDILGMLIDGHKLEVIDYQVLIEAGSIENVVTIVIKDVLDNDVTHNYDITYEYGTLTVHPRPITIKPKDVSKIYDGEYLTSNIVEIVEGSLLDNHFIEIVTNGYIKKAGRINNEIIDVYIYDNIKEVTKNYEITYVIGYLEVIPRDLYIQTSSSDKEYDGFELFSLEYYDINHQLVIGDFIIIDNYSKIKNVDVVENILDILIFDSNYDNVTESYHIIFEYGLLEIYPRYIKIKPIDIEKVYDDQILISNDYEIIEGSLAINETLMIETSGSIIEVGSIENEIIGFNMYNIENEETTLNYIVDIEIGYLKIIPRPIMVYSESETWIYNDEEFFNINISYELSQLVTGHQIRVIDYAKIIDVEVKQNELYVKISRENGDDVTHNYDISYSYGTLEVLPRPITVLSKSKDKIYDGYLLEYHEYEITFGSLVLGHELLPIFSSSITDVGEVNNDIEVSIYKGLRDVTLNYEITYDLGILKIYPRPITIETLSNSKTYDGEAILNPGYILKEGNLVLDHYFIIIEEPYMVDAGIQYNELVLDITNGERSYLSNYDITYIYGELIILPRPITIQTASDEKTYDDIEFYNLNHTIIEGSLVLDHLTIVDEFTVIKDAILTNNILRIKIVDSYSEDKTSNYDITYVYGLLEIYKRYVKIETASNHKIYDGLDLSDQNYTILDGSFVDSHTLIVLHSTKIKYVGSEFNYFDEIDILNANNESVLSNYLIEGAYGVLTIDPRPLSFIVSDKTFEYNGEPQTSKAYELIDDTSFGNDDILTFISTYITDVGTIENRIGDIKILNGEMDVTSNYLIDYVEGMLTVEPRYVRVRTNDDSKMFDGIPLTNHEFTIFEGSFVLDHELILAFDGIQAEIGISPNSAYEYYVLDGLGVDKTYNYIVDIEFGLLEVTRRVIEISTPSAEKVYDGLPLTAATYEITLGSVILEHQLIVHVIGSITEPGKMKNNYEFVILDTYGNDVSHYYIVQENLGTLKVIDPRIKITITSENASKPYDGTPLISEMWELTEGMLLDNHQLYVIMTGSQTEVGTSNNTFTYVILDENLEDIADIYYQVVLDFGTLYVYDENSSGGLPPGGISIDRTGTPSDDASLEKPLFKIFSEVSTMIYLRYASHGDYIPETGAFDEAIQYFGETVSPLAWPGYNLNQQSYLMKLETIVGGLSYMMPYYSVDGFNNRLSDVFIGKGFGKGYEINFIPYESDEILKQVPPMTHFSEEELVYREFVREHYLNIPEETKAQMLRIARQNGIKNTSPTLIEDIQLYILSAAIYNMDFDTIPDGVDAAVYFLEYLREGICQHFAMAATVMYRAFGIPARYVTGFVADAEKDEWVEVTAGKGHAWVEFYVDGFGWIPIEVTPGGAGGTNGSGRGSIPGRGSGNGAAIDGGEGGEGESGEGEGGAGIGGGGSGPIKPKITIQTSNDSKVYDGTPLENKNYYVSGDIKTGHEVIVNVTGTITQVGEKRNTFEYFIVDENGNDVASEYQIVKIPGTLVVVPVNDKEILEISLYNLTRVYNGKTFENKDGYWISSQNLPSGYKVELEILGSIKDVGIIETYVNYGSVRVYDEKGIDVTNRYNVVAYYGTIEVVKLSITLTTETKMKIYDGTPLTAHNAVVSKGKLINGDTLVLQYGGSQTIVGESKNNLVLIQIFDKNNQNVTNNYHITVIEGILTVIDTN
ncbi:transglutaminase-like domain-containing protein, partial [Acholeplasma equifetale]|uniref:transglutaminase-like domain-containing protein n=1 Tax=Acholeplasma equifetale TaxID=264634 RepID=UPI00054F8FE4